MSKFGIKTLAQLDAIPLRDLKRINGVGPAGYRAMRSYRGYRTALEVREEVVNSNGKVSSINRQEAMMAGMGFMDITPPDLTMHPGSKSMTEEEQEAVDLQDYEEHKAKEEYNRLKEEIDAGEGFFSDEPVIVGDDGRIQMTVTMKRIHYEWLVNVHRNVFKDRPPSNLVERMIREAYAKDPTKGGTLSGSMTFLNDQIDINLEA